MKKSQFFPAVLFVSLLFVLLPTMAKADMWDVPVATGETFRWVFVTSGTTNALSSDISYYNDFVNDAADDAATPITGVLGKSTIADIEWKAIASTPTVDAIDNIVESPASIFTPRSILVATGTSDLFSEHHDGRIETTELGGEYVGDVGDISERYVWTGTDQYGVSKGFSSLGGSSGWLGRGNNWFLLGGAWVDYAGNPGANSFPLYAISEELTVNNQPPVAICQGAVVVVGEVPDIDGGSYDPDEGDTITLTQSPPGAFNEAGIYDVTLTVTDSAGATDSCTAMVVVYDPSGGFVTGGGWIWSPQSDLPYMNVEGRANFGFVAKYKKGATTPTGQTEFVFKAGDLNFHSSSYQWLVVNQGGTNAQFKGSGTINGEDDCKFMLWAGDSPDTFRIKIWTEDDPGVETDVYDNGSDQAISGGSIMVHMSKEKDDADCPLCGGDPCIPPCGGTGL